MIDPITCPTCKSDVAADNVYCPVCAHSLRRSPCDCLFCRAGLVASDRRLAMTLLELLDSLQTDVETAEGCGVPATVSQATKERLARALQSLQES